MSNLKAIYHKRAKLLLIETNKTSTNGIVVFHKVRSKSFNNKEEAEKYAKRYLKNHQYSYSEF